MKKRFIIVIDFADYSENLLKYAYDWSLQVNADLLLFHQPLVLTPALADDESRESMVQEANDSAIQKLKDFRDSVLPSNAKVSYFVSGSHVQLTIPKLLAEPFESLVFVGLKETNWLTKMLLGNVAIQIIESTSNIVVAMPKYITQFSPEKIFVAVSEKYPLNIIALNNLLDFIGKRVKFINFFYLAKAFQQVEHIAHQLNDLSKLFSEKANTMFSIHEGEDTFADIKKIISDTTQEILVVQKGSRLLTDRLFRKLVINELVYQGQTPMIILP